MRGSDRGRGDRDLDRTRRDDRGEGRLREDDRGGLFRAGGRSGMAGYDARAPPPDGRGFGRYPHALSNIQARLSLATASSPVLLAASDEMTVCRRTKLQGCPPRRSIRTRWACYDWPSWCATPPDGAGRAHGGRQAG